MPRWHNAPRTAFHLSSGQGLALRLFSESSLTTLYPLLGMGTTLELHIQETGRTKDLNNKENSDLLAGPSMQVITPRTLLVLFNNDHSMKDCTI